MLILSLCALTFRCVVATIMGTKSLFSCADILTILFVFLLFSSCS